MYQDTSPSLGTLPTQAPMIVLDSSPGERVTSPVISGTRGRTEPASNIVSHAKEPESNAGCPSLVKNVPQEKPRPSEVGKRSADQGESHICSVVPSHRPNDLRGEAGPSLLATLSRPLHERGDDAARVEKTAGVLHAANRSGRKLDFLKFVLQPKRADNRIPCQVEGCKQTFCRASTAKRHFYRLRKL